MHFIRISYPHLIFKWPLLGWSQKKDYFLWCPSREHCWVRPDFTLHTSATQWLQASSTPHKDTSSLTTPNYLLRFKGRGKQWNEQLKYSCFLWMAPNSEQASCWAQSCLPTLNRRKCNFLYCHVALPRRLLKATRFGFLQEYLKAHFSSCDRCEMQWLGCYTTPLACPAEIQPFITSCFAHLLTRKH